MWGGWKIRDLAERVPGAREALAREGIDLCCGGEHTLAHLVQVRGKDTAALSTAIDEAAGSWLTPERSVAELLQRFPGVRAALDRRGLRDCGGERGPAETLAHFAAMHGISVEALLAEIRPAMSEMPSARPAGCPLSGAPAFAAFFRAAIVVLLTGGASFGAVMLLLYGLRGDFLSIPLFEWVQAHGFAMVNGFLFLFVAGFAFEALPRFRLRPPASPRETHAVLALSASAVLLRFATAGLDPAASAIPAALSTTAAVIFARFVFATVRPARDGADGCLLAGAVFYAIASAGEAALWLALHDAPTEATALSWIATWLPAIRDAQFLGFASLWIFGIGHRVWPAAMGFRAPSRGTRMALTVLPVAAAGAIAGWLVYRLGGATPLVAWGFQILFAIAAAIIVVTMRLWGASPVGGRSTKFIRAAVGWLLLALAMLVAMPAYIRAHGGFSHAYFGACRHALTVGFVTMAIAGVASRIVPTWTGRPPRSGLMLPFVLLNIGNLIRIGSQIATDWVGEPAFLVMPVSGAIEVIALAIWSVEVWPRRPRVIPQVA